MRYNPFNPQQPAKPQSFVGREKEIKTFESFLMQTMHGSPMNLSITGDRGMGKTSILNKFEDIAKINNCLTIKISNYEGNVKDILEFSDFIILNIQRELISKNITSKNIDSLMKWIKSLTPTLTIQGVSIALEKKQVIQELLRERLQDIWLKSKDVYNAIVILIDEAESLENIGALTFLREVFQRVEGNANYMLVLAGKFNFPERMSESFSPLNRFFPAQRLRILYSNDISTYLKNKLNDTGVSINKEVENIIAKKSEGHPYVLVAMSYLIFDSLRDDEIIINKEIINICMPKIKGRLSQDFFTPMLHPLSPKAKKVLC
ncbi:MAG: ATP-binding protein, partial [Nanoarchaeota archaeon]